jgi:hypothetical protein
MEKLNITQGECKVEHQSKHQIAITIGATAICFLPRFQDNVLDNATLLSDAINTYNTTPILPSELLKQNKELLNVLEMCAQDFCNGNIQNNPSSETRIKVFDALNNCKNA